MRSQWRVSQRLFEFSFFFFFVLLQNAIVWFQNETKQNRKIKVIFIKSSLLMMTQNTRRRRPSNASLKETEKNKNKQINRFFFHFVYVFSSHASLRGYCRYKCKPNARRCFTSLFSFIYFCFKNIFSHEMRTKKLLLHFAFFLFVSPTENS